MKIKQLSIFVENKEGRLAHIANLLANADVDIRALSIADTKDFGILRLIVNKPEEAVSALQENGVTVSLTEVIAVGVDDTPGAFANIVNMLSKEHLAVEYMYAFISRDKSRAFLILRVDDTERAINVLTENNVELLTCEKIRNM